MKIFLTLRLVTEPLSTTLSNRQPTWTDKQQLEALKMQDKFVICLQLNFFQR